MTYLPRLLSVALLTSALLLASSANAQIGGEQPDLSADQWDAPEIPTGYPRSYVLRPITLPAMTIRGEFAFTAGKFFGGFDDVNAIINLGGAFGILDNLEAGISDERIGLRRYYLRGLVAARLAPDARYGDFYLYGRYRFLQGETFQMAGEIGVQLATRNTTRHGITAALPFRLKVNEFFALDGGVEFSVQFGRAGADAFISLPITIQPRFSPVDFLYFGIDTGLYIDDVGGANILALPLGFEAGYVLDIDPTRIDIFANFTFPNLYTSIDAGGIRMGDSVAEVWALTIGARAYIDVGN